MADGGVFGVARGVFSHPMFAERRTFSRMEAWLWLLSEAAWKPVRREISGKIVELDRGQLAHSVRFMADAWGWSKSAVDRFLTRLKTETMIGTASGTGAMIITICKYNDYQKVALPERDKSGTASGTAAGQQRDKLKEGEGSERILPSPSIKEPQLGLVDIAAQPSTDEPTSTSRGKRISPDWKLSRPLGQWALEKWPHLTADQVREEAEAFKDYWIAASGQRASKREWSAAFREWMRRSDVVKAPRARASKYSGFEEAKRKVQQELADAGYSGQEGDRHGDDGGLPLLAGPSRQRHR